MTYTVTDEHGSTAMDTFDITVATGVALNAPTDQTYTMGRPITALTLPAATGGTGTLTYTLRDGSGNDVDTTDNAVPGLTFNTTNSRPVRHADHGGDHGPDLYRHRPERQHRLGYLQHHRGGAGGGDAPNDQTYTMGRPITALTLPPATGGTGTLTYTLRDGSGRCGRHRQRRARADL